MTDEELAVIRKRHIQMTGGPWRYGPSHAWADLFVTIGEGREVKAAQVSARFPTDVDFLTHAYEDVDALLSEVERLRADLETLANARARDMVVLMGAKAELRKMREIVEAVANGVVAFWDDLPDGSRLLCIEIDKLVWNKARALIAKEADDGAS